MGSTVEGYALAGDLAGGKSIIADRRNARNAYGYAVLRDAHTRLRRNEQDVAKLTRWMETLESQASALVRSRRWRVGDALVNLHRRALLRSREPVVTQQMSEILGRFHAWRTGEELQEDEIPTKKEESPDA